ncbi:MAG TPA: MarR family transcriptional regulator [Candidatus Ozemobacteraceae bacterium]|nr:MarR family transcriptional regulator [Candidatus Ozemobacteraceae bacterium]
MGTHYRGTREETRALDAFIKLLRAADAVSRRTREVISTAGLTESRFGVLEALYHLGPLSPGELGRKILKTAGNLTLVIDNLERDGLVERRSGLNDRRVKRVALTRQGRDLIERLLPPHAELIVSEMSVLTAEEQIELARLCKKLGLKQDTH